MSSKIDTDLLKPFLEDPQREFHLREFARIHKISPTTAGKILENLRKDNYLLKKKERGHLLYRANTDSVEYKYLKAFYNVSKINDSGLVDFLVDEFNYPEAIVLFGSYAKSENTPKSDIDIFVLSEIKKEPEVSRFEKALKCKIQLFSANRTKFNQMTKESKELLNNILNGKILYGYLEVFR